MAETRFGAVQVVMCKKKKKKKMKQKKKKKMKNGRMKGYQDIEVFSIQYLIQSSMDDMDDMDHFMMMMMMMMMMMTKICIIHYALCIMKDSQLTSSNVIS